MKSMFIALCLMAPSATAEDMDTKALELALRSDFDHSMARKLAQNCDDLAFDENGRRIYFLKLDGAFYRMGKSVTDWLGVRFSMQDYEPLNAEFAERHGDRVFLDRAVLCAAGRDEIDSQTGIGRMLKRVEE
ncbi:hypothetical protein [Actibacterium ureilyticum]|uniref:hypothetical protein n=1 Tax=Actibacterium ureilyticum TaxID=1590614 RepID=UPI001140B61B|nr:hypothetical protein [Actibacterium ureilyticum]